MKSEFILMLSEPLENRRVEEIREGGCEVLSKIPLFSFLHVQVPVESIVGFREHLRGLDYILGFEAERKSSDIEDLDFDSATATFEPDFDFEEHRRSMLPEYARGHDGSGAKCAVLDSGIDHRNPDIEGVAGRKNFTESDQLDDTGHGTSVAHILQRMAPGVDIHDYKVVSDEGLRESRVIEALAECVREGMDFVNISLGFSDHRNRDPCPLYTAANYTVGLGTPVSAAAGNHGTEEHPQPAPLCPARASGVLAVGALRDGEVATYSGDADLYGPGDWIVKDG